MKWRARRWPDGLSGRRLRRTLCGSLASLGVMALLAGCGPATDPASTPSISLAAPRDFGYALGDLIDHTVSIELPDGARLDPGALPQPGPVNEWLNLRDSRWDIASSNGHERLRLHLVYQVFKGVRTPEETVIPPLTLRLTGNPPRELHTPAWPFTLAPVIPPDLADADVELREPAEAETVPTAPLFRQLLLWLTGASGAGLLFGLRRLLRNRRTRPFATAARQMQAALSGRYDAEALRDACKILHRAFDHTFGETLFAGQIERFCAAHPVFTPLEDRLSAFFVLSRHLFFDPDQSGAADPTSRDWLADLSRRCAAAERKAL